MATGDAADFASRIRSTLPAKWFPDSSPNLVALLTGMGSAWSLLFAQLSYANVQTRLLTVSDGFLDLAARDYRGTGFVRKGAESDANLRARLLPIFRDKATRAALIARLLQITGNVATVFEPSRPADTGGYNVAMGYGVAGAYGSLILPGQVFITIARPLGQGIPNVSGYGSGAGGYGVGAIAYAQLAAEGPHVSDSDIYAAIVEVLPVGSIGWTALAGTPVGGNAALDQFLLGFNTLSSGA